MEVSMWLRAGLRMPVPIQQFHGEVLVSGDRVDVLACPDLPLTLLGLILTESE